MDDQNIYERLKDLLPIDDMEATPPVVNASLIRDRLNTVRGWVNAEGVILDGVRNRRGKVTEDGKVLSTINTQVGSVDEDGLIRNHYGILMGRIGEDGIIRAINNLKVGSVKDMDVTSRIRAGGAAMLLLLRGLYD